MSSADFSAHQHRDDSQSSLLGFGSLLWGVLLTATVMSIALVLSWRPRGLKPLVGLLRVKRGG